MTTQDSVRRLTWLDSGYICIALPAERLEELEIPMMVAENQDPHRTAYTVTVDYRHGAYVVLYKCTHI